MQPAPPHKRYWRGAHVPRLTRGGCASHCLDWAPCVSPGTSHTGCVKTRCLTLRSPAAARTPDRSVEEVLRELQENHQKYKHVETELVQRRRVVLWRWAGTGELRLQQEQPTVRACCAAQRTPAWSGRASWDGEFGAWQAANERLQCPCMPPPHNFWAPGWTCDPGFVCG